MVAVGNAVCHIIPEILVKVVILSKGSHKAAQAWGLELGKTSLQKQKHIAVLWERSSTKQVFPDPCRLQPCNSWNIDDSNCSRMTASVQMRGPSEL